jgi:hypothetical protein
MNVTTALRMLDVDTMRAVFAEVPALAGVSGPVELATLWVKPGRYFNAHYRVGKAGISAFIVERERGERVLAKSCEHTCDGGDRLDCRACGTRLAADDLLLQVFPWDYRLPTLPQCLDTTRVRRAVPALEVTASTVKAYRPGMRCQIAYDTQSGGKVFGKVAVERRGDGYSFRTQQRLYAALSSRRPAVAIPEPLDYVEPLRLTVVAAVEGTSLHDLADAARQQFPEARAAARAIGELHSLGAIIDDRIYGTADEMDLVTKWVGLAQQLFPELASAFDARLHALIAAKPENAEPRAVLHRDFHDKQILFREGAVPVLLDMDTAASGDPELDIGNFCAHLRLRAIQHDRRELCERLEEAFLGAYPHRFDLHRMEWYRRAALLRLACNYGLRPRWRHIAERVIEAASR